MRKHSQHFFRMPRHLYFRNNRDMTPGILTIPVHLRAISTGLQLGASFVQYLRPPFPTGRAFQLDKGDRLPVRQFRITFDFQSPTRTVCQMPMKAIQL